MTEKIAVVTGGNKGIGFAVVKGLCQNFKGRVYLTARNEARGKEAVQKLNDIGLKPLFYKLDVTDVESVKAFASFLTKNYGGFDVLVNNAAILEWNDVYPSYEAAKRNIDTNYKSLLMIEDILYPLLRDGARVVNVSGACGHLSNIKNKTWIETLFNPDLTTEQLNGFVDGYLESVRNGTFNKDDFAVQGKHAEHRVSKIGLTALTMIQQRKYIKRNISINAVDPGYVRTDMTIGGGELDPDEATTPILYLILKASPNIKGTFMSHGGGFINWLDAETNYGCEDLW